MPFVRISWIVFLCLWLSAQVSPPPESAFGKTFFEDLRRLFGELQRSELDQVFQRAKAPQCAELGLAKAEWKQVAYLNDDRTLAAWHFDSIEQVKKDLSKYVFEGKCSDEDTALQVLTSFPMQNNQSVSSIRDNRPVRGVFDRRSQSFVFELPYLYQIRKVGPDVTYTLIPPQISSKPASDVAEELRCKALSDSELTYRFLLCRARLVDHSTRTSSRDFRPQPLGSAAYHILSDGNEARSSVKLTFEDAVEPAKTPVAWQSVPPERSLSDLATKALRVEFDTKFLANAPRHAQLLINGVDLDLSSSTKPKGDYCAWYPVGADAMTDTEAASTVVLQLATEKSAISAAFEMESDGRRRGTLMCYFSNVDSVPAVTVGRWQSIVGDRMMLLTLQ